MQMSPSGESIPTGDRYPHGVLLRSVLFLFQPISIMNNKPCHTRTYLTEDQERIVADALLKELSLDGRTLGPRERLKLLPAPAEMCDLIF